MGKSPKKSGQNHFIYNFPEFTVIAKHCIDQSLWQLMKLLVCKPSEMLLIKSLYIARKLLKLWVFWTDDSISNANNSLYLKHSVPKQIKSPYTCSDHRQAIQLTDQNRAIWSTACISAFKMAPVSVWGGTGAGTIFILKEKLASILAVNICHDFSSVSDINHTDAA